MLLFFRKILKYPEQGVYAAFFASGILNTISLGPFREKVGLTELVILLTWLSMILNVSWKNKRSALTQYQVLAFIFLLIFLIIEWSSFFINNATFYGSMTSSLIETLNMTYGAMMTFTVVLLVQTEAQWKGCLIGWMIGAAVVVIVGIWAMSGSAPSWTFDEFTGRISSTLKFENQIASYLVPVLTISIIWCVSKAVLPVYRNCIIVLAIGMGITLIGTGSRTAFLLLILMALCLCFFIVVQFNNASLKRSYLGALILLCSVGLIGYVTIAIALFDGNYVLGKTPAWQRPVVALYQSIKRGDGIDHTREKQANIVEENADRAMFLGNGPKLYSNKLNTEEIHNTYAGVYIETGLLGIFSLLLFLLTTIFIGWKSKATSEMKLLFIAAVFGFLLLLLYNFTMYGLRQRTIWLMAGLLLSANTISRSRNLSSV
jgi:hypothetical protein